MTSSTLHRPGTDHDMLLPVFAIRAELEAIADRATLEQFAEEVEHAIRSAAGEGTVEPVNRVLRFWLRIALAGRDEGYARLSRAERARRAEELMAAWVRAHTA